MRVVVSSLSVGDWWADTGRVNELPGLTGADGVELILEGSHQPSRLDPDRLTVDVESVHAPFADVNLATPSDHHREYALDVLRRSVELARDLGARYVVMHPGHLTPVTVGDRDLALDLCIEALREARRIVRNEGLVPAVENMPDHELLLGSSPEEIAEIVRASGCRFALDIGHALTCEGSPLPYLEELKPCVIHVHDNAGDRDEHRPPGEGILRERELGEALEAGELPVIEVKSVEGARRGVALVRRLLG
ncbi:MAG: sugar phosphate isomerase/epimerase family protein [Euryarchaeota archaeon]